MLTLIVLTALQALQILPGQTTPVLVDQVGLTPLHIAMIAFAQIVFLALITWASTAYKDSKDAQRSIAAATAAAKIKSDERQEDWARQDQVAERAVDAAKKVADEIAHRADLLLQAQKETIARTDEVARMAAVANAQVQSQLTAIDEQGKKIHILVNSDMTAARTNERDQTRLTLLALKRVQMLSENLGLVISDEELKAIDVAEKRITELDRILADRHAAQLAVEEEARRTGTSAAPTPADGTITETLLGKIEKNTAQTVENTKGK
jgi:hypothetical protein